MSSDMPSNAKFLALYLSTFMNDKHQVAWPSQGRIIKETGLSNGTVNKHLGILESGGWILRHRGNSRKTTRYTARIPADIQQKMGLLDSPPDGELNELDTPADGELTLQQVETNKPINKPLLKKEREKKKANQDWRPPDWLNLRSWQEFEQHRRDIRKPLTNLARDKLMKALVGLTAMEQQKTIDKSIQNRWAGLFPAQEQKNESSSRNSRPESDLSRLTRSCIEELEST